MMLRGRPDAGLMQRKAVVEGRFRGQIKAAVPPLLAR
jgi:hypothetical protein